MRSLSPFRVFLLSTSLLSVVACGSSDTNDGEASPGGAAGASGQSGAGQAGAGQAGAGGSAAGVAGQAGSSGSASGVAGSSGASGGSGQAGASGAGQAGSAGEGGSAGEAGASGAGAGGAGAGGEGGGGSGAGGEAGVSGGAGQSGAGGAEPTCTDAIKNGNEGDTDCGGSCPVKCAADQACNAPEDCADRICTNGKCVQGTCSDGVLNAGESGVDCGTVCGKGCKDGNACEKASDCQSGICTKEICVGASCTDDVKNGSETDKDCGGFCLACGPGQHCLVNADCDQVLCKDTVCQQPACDDGIKNGSETDKDCGGSCAPCSTGKECKLDKDCDSDVCKDGKCAAPTCDDGHKNGGEGDKDCGAVCATKCATGQTCGSHDDCASGACQAGVCQALVEVTKAVDLSTTSLVGRACGDAVSLPVASLTASAVTLATAPAACLDVGDEVMLINEQGAGAAVANVGVYEFLTVASVADNVVTFSAAKKRFYGATAGADDAIGTGANQQRVALIRVPHYGALRVTATGSLTTAAWAGQMGGVLPLRAVVATVNGSISVKARGYRDGRWSTDAICNASLTTTQGESIGGLGVQSSSASYGASGGIGAVSNDDFNNNTPINASAGHAVAGQSGYNFHTRTPGQPGGTYGSPSGDLLTMGSGVGGNLTCGPGQALALQAMGAPYAGGAIFVGADVLTVSSTGSITADAVALPRDAAPSAGSISLRARVLDLGTGRVTATGATAIAGSPPTVGHVNKGGNGHISVYYATSVTGTTSPVAFSQQTNSP